ncbi:Beta sliding clamp [Planctomycetaceae bacterium]|nr:Beta sliding clamp [Planctomycetaceae bacterium]
MNDTPKFSVRVNNPKAFTRAFKLAAGTALKHSRYGNRVCENVVLRVSGFKALLLATDLEQYLTIDLGLTDCQLSLDGDGALFLPSDWKVPGTPFELKFEPTDTGPKVTLKHGVVETEILQDCNADEWPNFPLRNAGCKFELPAARLAHDLNTIAPLCAAEKGRYALNGVFFEFDGTKPEDAGPFYHPLPPFKAQLVATDGRHLGMSQLPVTITKTPPRFQPLLASVHALNVSKIMLALETDEAVEVGFAPEVEDTDDKGNTQNVRPHEPYMFFGTRTWSYTARTIEGQFPDWHSVVPKTDANVILNRQAFIDALQAVKHACSVDSAAARLTFNADHLLIEAKSHQHGYAKTQIALCAVPPMMTLGLDPEYLIEACNALTGEWIVFSFRSSEYGVSIHDGAPEMRYQLVMPIDLGDQPVEPKEPQSTVKDEVWDGKKSAMVKVSDEAKAAAQAEYEQAVAQHKLDMEKYKLELAAWRLHKRQNVKLIDGEESDWEQDLGEFTPRPATEPAIGQKLAECPTLEELHAKALTADPVVKVKRAKPVKTAPTTVQATPDFAKATSAKPVPQKPEPEPTEASEQLETAADLGYSVNKDQQILFGW